MRVAGGGKLFWEDFEKRVVETLTKEHKELKRTHEAVDYWRNKYSKQKCIMLDAYGDEDNNDRLSLCESCKDFFLYDDNDDNHCACECGHTFCGQETDTDICQLIICSKCEDKMFFYCCGTICDGCEQELCSTCAPHNPDLEVACPHGNGQSFLIYCSIECKNASQTEQGSE